MNEVELPPLDGLENRLTVTCAYKLSEARARAGSAASLGLKADAPDELRGYSGFQLSMARSEIGKRSCDEK